MPQKYEMSFDDTKKIGAKTLFRIVATKNFADVKAGDLGGYIESEQNLSHSGEAWIYHNAIACDSARVVDNAQLRDSAKARDYALIKDNAKVFGNAQAGGCCEIGGHAFIYGQAKIGDQAKIYDFVKVSGRAEVKGISTISGRTTIMDYAIIEGDAELKGSILVNGRTRLGEGMIVSSNADVISISGIGDVHKSITFVKVDEDVLVAFDEERVMSFGGFLHFVQENNKVLALHREIPIFKAIRDCLLAA